MITKHSCIYKYTENGKEKATDPSLYIILHDKLKPEMTSLVFRETFMGIE